MTRYKPSAMATGMSTGSRTGLEACFFAMLKVSVSEVSAGGAPVLAMPPGRERR